MKEFGFLLEPAYPPEKVKFANISNGRRTFLIDLIHVPNALQILKKVFVKEERQKIIQGRD